MNSISNKTGFQVFFQFLQIFYTLFVFLAEIHKNYPAQAIGKPFFLTKRGLYMINVCLYE